MRILTLSNCLLRASEGSGGIILALTEGLRQRGHQVDLFGPDDYEVGRWMRPRANSYRQALGMYRFAKARLLTTDYDLLEIYGGEGWLTFTRLQRQQRSRPLFVSHSNGIEPHAHLWLAYAGEGKRHWWQLDQTQLMAQAFRNANGLIVLSEFDREFVLREQYQQAERVVTVPPGLSPEFFNVPLETERAPVIGYCGNWLPRKGIALMQQALPEILREFPKVRLLLVGVGKEYRVADWFPSDILPRIEAVTWVDNREQLIKLYQRMSIFLMPSYYESFGLVAAEAMACSAAVVTSKSGFGAALCNGKNALVIEPLTAEGLANACRKLLRDEGFRRQIAEQGYKRAQNLRWEHSITRLETTYQHWLEAHKHCSRFESLI